MNHTSRSEVTPWRAGLAQDGNRPVSSGRRRRSGPSGPVGVVVGLLVDRWIGDPADTFHPVAYFGRLMSSVERSLWAESRLAGIGYAVVGGAVAAVAARVLDQWGSLLSVSIATATSLGGRSLVEAAANVEAALERGDLDAARHALVSLVGRDTDHLSEEEIVRAVVESVAENTTDAVVAPALWALVGGATGTLVLRAVNTMDAMVGYRSDRYRHFGWAAARLDDVMMWPAARLTALLVCVVRPARALLVWRAVRQDAPGHPSPNAGVSEAAFAAALGVQLGGPTTYGGAVRHGPTLGGCRGPMAQDIEAAARLSEQVGAALAALLVAGVTATWWRGRVNPARHGSGVRSS